MSTSRRPQGKASSKSDSLKGVGLPEIKGETLGSDGGYLKQAALSTGAGGTKEMAVAGFEQAIAG
jgi:hypothetical protein